MAKGTAPKVAVRQFSDDTPMSKRVVDFHIPKYRGDLMDAGAELLPLLHEISTVNRSLEVCRYERLATAIWKLLREAWAAWWEIHKVYEPSDSWALWQQATGSWELWKQAGLAELVKFWMERADPPYQITHDEMSKLMRWLYGVPYERKDRPDPAPPFWVTEMLDPYVPGFEQLVERDGNA